MIELKTDNRWHYGVLTEKEDGTLRLVDNSDQVTESNVKYNWNRGQPIVVLPDDTTLRIVDIAIDPIQHS